jgi:hypothetical protein
MGRVVHYHHPEAENFSLKYSSASPADLVSRREELDGATKRIGYPFDTPVYVLYESETEIEAARDMDFDEEWLSDRITELSHEGQVVAFRLVELLEAAVDVREADEFRLYKEFEPQKIEQALEHVSWGNTLPKVAGELMSNLILRHSLPNANHRTGIAMLQFCIESADSDFVMPRTHLNDETWQEWVDPYIHSDLLCSTLPDLGRHKTHSSTESLTAMVENIVSEWISSTPSGSSRSVGTTFVSIISKNSMLTLLSGKTGSRSD